MSSEEYVCELPEEVQTYAREVLHETDSSRKAGFEEIKRWAEENSHLNVRTEDKYILPFLRVAKFDLEKTKEKLTNFYTMRRDRTEWFTNRDPKLPEIQELVKMGCFSVLKKTSENQMIVVVRPTFHDPKMHNMDDVIKTGLMIVDISVMEEELAQIYGVIGIIDMKNISFGHAKQMTPTRIKNLVYSWQNFNVRPQRIEFVNAPSYFNVVLDIFKNCMSQKLRQRIHVCYGGCSSLLNIIDKEILPKDYGGDGETLEELGKYWNEKLIARSQWLAEDEKYKAETETSGRKNWFSRQKSNK